MGFDPHIRVLSPNLHIGTKLLSFAMGLRVVLPRDVIANLAYAVTREEGDTYAIGMRIGSWTALIEEETLELAEGSMRSALRSHPLALARRTAPARTSGPNTEENDNVL